MQLERALERRVVGYAVWNLPRSVFVYFLDARGKMFYVIVEDGKAVEAHSVRAWRAAHRPRMQYKLQEPVKAREVLRALGFEVA